MSFVAAKITAVHYHHLPPSWLVDKLVAIAETMEESGVGFETAEWS